MLMHTFIKYIKNYLRNEPPKCQCNSRSAFILLSFYCLACDEEKDLSGTDDNSGCLIGVGHSLVFFPLFHRDNDLPIVNSIIVINYIISIQYFVHL